MSSSDPSTSTPAPTPPTSGTSGGSGTATGGSTGDNSGGDANDSSKSTANLFSFATVVMGLLALVVLTLFVVSYYGKDGVSSATSILGIILTPLAAIFGATVAYNVGDSRGAEKGEETGKKDVKATLTPKLQRIDSTVNSFLSKIQTQGTSLSGSDRVVFGVRPLRDDETVIESEPGFDQRELNDVRAAVAELRATIDAI